MIPRPVGLIGPILVASLAFGAANGAATEPAAQSKELVAWVEAHAVPLNSVDAGDTEDDDLRALDGLISSKTRVIALAEGGFHNSHEMLALRNRLFKYLVKRHGVTALSTESEFSGGFAVDDYLVHGGELTPQIVASVYCWEDPRTAWEENASLLRWMREHNSGSRVGRPLRFYAGISGWDDAKDGNPAPIPLRHALSYLRRVDARLADSLQSRLSWSGATAYADLTEQKRDEIAAAVADLVNEFKANHLAWVRATSAEDFGRAVRSAFRAEELDAWRRRQLRAGGVAPLAGWQEADHILAALEKEGPEGRLFVFYHSSHSDNRSNTNSFGPRLREALRDRYVLIGATPDFNPQRPEDIATITKQFALLGLPWDGWDPRATASERFLAPLYPMAGLPTFYLDMRNMPPVNVPIDVWRRAGSSYVAEDSKLANPSAPHVSWKAQTSYDAMIFLPTVTPVRPWQRN